MKLVRRRAALPAPTWSRSKKENAYTRLADGATLTVFPSVLEPGRYAWCIYGADSGSPRDSIRCYATEAEARAAVFAAL